MHTVSPHNFGGPKQVNTESEDDADMLALKQNIKAALSRQRDEAFAEMAFAAKSGDVEIVRGMLRKGVDINESDYDGRTVLAMASHKSLPVPGISCSLEELLKHLDHSYRLFTQACFEGSYKVVEMLLEEGAFKNSKNRWGHTPLSEAMQNRYLQCSAE